ncbi:MAG: NAD(P)/FAD-dependent oxidoreductase [Candidatus Omnitrophica bacterium]|nr:NAD(P)/FAD-dependent oxidoreductase [Candidatus Omnitrophota bacterium]
MGARNSYDVVVIGSGPNGLAAAITLARRKLSVLVIEACDTIGGGMRSKKLTLPGFTHDVCSTIHALGAVSPFFLTLPLSECGLEWIEPEAPLAHPLEKEPAVLLERSLEKTAGALDGDGRAWRRIFKPVAGNWRRMAEDLLGPFTIPKHPVFFSRFGFHAIRSAAGLAHGAFKNKRAKALFAGLASHSILPLERPATAAVAIVLGALGHVAGWPVAKGGSQKLADALSIYLRSLGGEIQTGIEVRSLDELPKAKAIFCDITPRQLLQIAGNRLPERYRKRMERYRYGPGVFKIDFALSGPIPWEDPAVLRAATVHVGGTMEEIAAGEAAVWRGEHPEKPFVILAQTSLCDPTRAPTGKQTGWAYCHVPSGSTVDMSGRIIAQIERFAPGFKERILAAHTMTTKDFQEYNANYIGGDIIGGVQDLGQLYTRPASLLNPYSTPVPGLYLCSSSTPPGGGVHGMCGVHAARAALKQVFK